MNFKNKSKSLTPRFIGQQHDKPAFAGKTLGMGNKDKNPVVKITPNVPKGK